MSLKQTLWIIVEAAQTPHLHIAGISSPIGIKASIFWGSDAILLGQRWTHRPTNHSWTHRLSLYENLTSITLT